MGSEDFTADDLYLKKFSEACNLVINEECGLDEVSRVIELNNEAFKDAVEQGCDNDREVYQMMNSTLNEEFRERTMRSKTASPIYDAFRDISISSGDSSSRVFPRRPSSSLSAAGVQIARVSKRRLRPPRLLIIKRRNRHRCPIQSVENNSQSSDLHLPLATSDKSEKSSYKKHPLAVAFVCCAVICIAAFMPHQFFPWFAVKITHDKLPPV